MDETLSRYRVTKAPPTVLYIPNFISEDEEHVLLSQVYSVPKPKWTQLSNRRLQNWGGVPHSKGMIADTIPQWLDKYLDRIYSLNLMEGKKPNHVLINEYLAGQGIMPHLDGFLFYPTITTISLSSHTVLNFYQNNITDDAKMLTCTCSLLLEPRSLVVLKDDMFTKYLHSIREITEDHIDDKISNLELCTKDYSMNTYVKRDTRVSLTIRHVPKTTLFKLNLFNK